ncbi:hypothetical protein BJ508DRAFT_337020, partial [Ascobolus immersus RN42]
ERRYRHDGDHPEKEELFHEEGQPQANHQHDSGTQSLQKRERKRVISEELYHREDGIRKKGRGREEGYNNHVKDNTAEAVSTTSTDVDEEGSDDFENTYFTPEENKHPDDFLDEDEIDPDFEPLESPSEPDEEEFEEKYSDSDAVGYVGKNEKTERNSRHTDRSTNDGLEYDSDRESSYQPSMHMENTTGGIYQRDIQTIRKACFYIHEDHEGTNVDPLIKKEHMPGNIPRDTVYRLELKMTPQGVPMIAAIYSSASEDFICGWLPYSNASHTQIERLILAFHFVRVRISWQYSMVNGISEESRTYVGTCVWEAICDEGYGLNTNLKVGKEEKPRHMSTTGSRYGPVSSQIRMEDTSPITRMFREEEEGKQD